MADNLIDPTLPIYKKHFENIKNYILHSCGYPVVRIELDELNVINNILKAIRRYCTYESLEYAVRELYPEGPNAGSNVFKIPADIDKIHIVDVLFERDALFSGFGSVDGMGSLLPGYSYAYLDTFMANFDVAQYYMYLQQIQDFKTMLQIQKHWDIVNDTIVVHPTNSSVPRIGLLYGEIPKLADIEKIEWINDYSLALCKITLGMVRRKYSGMQMPGGGLSLDGDALVSEGNAEKEKLDADLMKRMRPLPFLKT
jgi:hypothetical protein